MTRRAACISLTKMRLLVRKGGAALLRPIFKNIAIFKQSVAARAGARDALVSSTAWNFGTGVRLGLIVRKKDK